MLVEVCLSLCRSFAVFLYTETFSDVFEFITLINYVICLNISLILLDKFSVKLLHFQREQYHQTTEAEETV
jgi:hypothetical protein